MTNTNTVVGLAFARFYRRTLRPELDARATAMSEATERRLAEIESNITSRVDAIGEGVTREIGEIKASLASDPFDAAEFDRAFEEGMKT